VRSPFVLHALVSRGAVAVEDEKLLAVFPLPTLVEAGVIWPTGGGRKEGSVSLVVFQVNIPE